jgi:hypothetical protein
MINVKVKKVLVKNLINIPGWQTKRKLIIIESDDWGSIRMPSREVYNKIIKEGIDLLSDEGSRFNKYDSLATSEDLKYLFELLNSIKDCTGRSTVITPVSVVANPDFDRILQSDFNEYFFEPFTETLKRYPGCENSYNLWREGINKRLFVPQFHGREHLNVKVWMNALKGNHERIRHAFKNGMWGISTANDPEVGVELQAAFDFVNNDDLNYQKEVIVTGLKLFERLFGYPAVYFVPPNGPFSSSLEATCAEEGIKYLSASKIQTEPLGQGRTKKKLHWLGQTNRAGLTFITRNCFFEPSLPEQDWVDSCLNDIYVAFRWQKPAVISTHRVNYIGALDTRNRDAGLDQLSSLLKQIMKKWPDAEFLTSAELGEIVNSE